MSRLPPQPNNSRLAQWLLRRLPVIITSGKWVKIQRQLERERLFNAALSEKLYHLENDYRKLVDRLYRCPSTSRVAYSVDQDQYTLDSIIRIKQQYNTLNYNVAIPNHLAKISEQDLHAETRRALKMACSAIAEQGARMLEVEARERVYQMLQIQETKNATSTQEPPA